MHIKNHEGKFLMDHIFCQNINYTHRLCAGMTINTLQQNSQLDIE